MHPCNYSHASDRLHLHPSPLTLTAGSGQRAHRPRGQHLHCIPYLGAHTQDGRGEVSVIRSGVGEGVGCLHFRQPSEWQESWRQSRSTSSSQKVRGLSRVAHALFQPHSVPVARLVHHIVCTQLSQLLWFCISRGFAAPHMGLSGSNRTLRRSRRR